LKRSAAIVIALLLAVIYSCKKNLHNPDPVPPGPTFTITETATITQTCTITPTVTLTGTYVPGSLWYSAAATPGFPYKPGYGGRFLYGSAVLDNKIWLFGGTHDSWHDIQHDVYSSSDGGTWTMVTGTAEFAPRMLFGSLAFNNKLWVLGGAKNFSDFDQFNDVWSSGDGATWQRVTGTAEFGYRCGLAAVEFNNQIWVIGGAASNSVWKSSDGAIWTLAVSSAPFTPRFMHAALVFADKMWVIGGGSDMMNPIFQYNDVWNSEDGITWTQVTSSAAFSPRLAFASAVYDNKMWVIGGAASGGNLNDVWFSEDGALWIRATADAGFSTTFGHASVNFNSKLWVIGGANYMPQPVWWSQ
jgi:hypothetical protein